MSARCSQRQHCVSTALLALAVGLALTTSLVQLAYGQQINGIFCPPRPRLLRGTLTNVSELELRLTCEPQYSVFGNTSYTCQQVANGMASWVGNQFCDDMDECANDLHTCVSYASCENIVDTFRCRCPPGYEGLGCLDIDECDTGIFKCGSLQTSCVNTNGSYYCVCNAGFTGNAAVAGGCRDINECAANSHNCTGANSVCFNIFGGFGCCRNGVPSASGVPTCRQTSATVSNISFAVNRETNGDVSNVKAYIVWNEPDAGVGDDFLQYLVTYRVASSGMTTLGGSRNTTTLLDNLQPETVYTADVAVVTTGGIGPSVAFTEYPLPQQPARIRTPTNIQVTSNSLTVQVVPTPTGNFNISAYCAIFNQEMVSGNRVNVQRRICNTTMEVTYENAPEDTVIRIFALICNNVNICGLTSFSTVRKTLPTQPSAAITNLIALPTMNGSVALAWRNLDIYDWNSPFREFLVEYRRVGTTGKLTTTTQLPHVIISTLIPGAQYIFSISFVAANGASPAVAKTYPSAPSAAPTDMRFWPLSSGDLSVSWLAVDETHWNGHYQGYRIYYYPSSAGRPKLSVFTTNTSNAEIKNIPVDVPHTYELQLITSGGMGPAVRRTGVLYPTLPTAAPSNIGYTSMAAESIDLFWRNLDTSARGGEFLYFQITVRQAQSSTVTAYRSQQNTITLRNISVGVPYQLTVAFVGTGGQGPAAVYQYPRPVTAVVSNLRTLNFSSSEIYISWDNLPTSDRIGEVDLYRVIVDGPSVPGGVPIVRNTSDLNVTIGGLDLSKKTNISVAFVGVQGAGPYSSNSFPGAPKAAPKNLRFMTLASPRITVLWDDLEQLDQNGPLHTYVLTYSLNTSSIRSQVLTTDTSTTIELTAGAQYMFDVRFVSTIATGPSAFAMYPAAPTGVASNWFFTPYDNGSVVMTWDNPPNTEWNGEFSGYELSYGLASSGLTNTTQPSQSRIVLKNIVPLTQYLFSLIFISTGGRGPNITFRAYPVPADPHRPTTHFTDNTTDLVINITTRPGAYTIRQYCTSVTLFSSSEITSRCGTKPIVSLGKLRDSFVRIFTSFINDANKTSPTAFSILHVPDNPLLDECATGRHICDLSQSKCTDTAQSYQCTCKDGYLGFGVTLYGGSCLDINECADGLHDCALPIASCNNIGGSFTCPCDAGYSGSGRLSSGGCQDIDECATGTHNCIAPDAICVNLVGSYVCGCRAFYNGTGVVASGGCQDIDECATTDYGTCSTPAGVCVNTPGTFRCNCSSGYRRQAGVDSPCTDIDECAVASTCSDTKAVCVNSNGSVSCPCLPFYNQNNTESCVSSVNATAYVSATTNVAALDFTLAGSVARLDEYSYRLLAAACRVATSSAASSAAYNIAANEINFFGDLVIPGAGNHSALSLFIRGNCLSGTCRMICSDAAFRMSENPVTGFDVPLHVSMTNEPLQYFDECSLGVNACFNNTMCVDLPRGYLCSCPPGTTGDGRNCSDLSVYCPPFSYPNAQSASTTRRFEDSLTAECIPGFTKSNQTSSTLVCSRSSRLFVGMWKGNLTCSLTPNFCPVLEILNTVGIGSIERTLGTIAPVNCTAGYVARGTPRVCVVAPTAAGQDPRGMWRGDESCASATEAASSPAGLYAGLACLAILFVALVIIIVVHRQSWDKVKNTANNAILKIQRASADSGSIYPAFRTDPLGQKYSAPMIMTNTLEEDAGHTLYDIATDDRFGVETSDFNHDEFSGPSCNQYAVDTKPLSSHGETPESNQLSISCWQPGTSDNPTLGKQRSNSIIDSAKIMAVRILSGSGRKQSLVDESVSQKKAKSTSVRYASSKKKTHDIGAWGSMDSGDEVVISSISTSVSELGGNSLVSPTGPYAHNPRNSCHSMLSMGGDGGSQSHAVQLSVTEDDGEMYDFPDQPLTTAPMRPAKPVTVPAVLVPEVFEDGDEEEYTEMPAPPPVSASISSRRSVDVHSTAAVLTNTIDIGEEEYTEMPPSPRVVSAQASVRKPSSSSGTSSPQTSGSGGLSASRGVTIDELDIDDEEYTDMPPSRGLAKLAMAKQTIAEVVDETEEEYTDMPAAIQAMEAGEEEYTDMPAALQAMEAGEEEYTDMPAAIQAMEESEEDYLDMSVENKSRTQPSSSALGGPLHSFKRAGSFIKQPQTSPRSPSLTHDLQEDNYNIYEDEISKQSPALPSRLPAKQHNQAGDKQQVTSAAEKKMLYMQVTPKHLRDSPSAVGKENHIEEEMYDFVTEPSSSAPLSHQSLGDDFIEPMTAAEELRAPPEGKGLLARSKSGRKAKAKRKSLRRTLTMK